MGRTYSAQLAFPRARTAEVLRDLAVHADPVGEVRVTLPDGARLTLPFTRHGEDADVQVEEGAWTGLDGAFWFPLDEAGARFLAEDDVPRRHRGGDVDVRVGYVFLTLGVGARYTLVTLSAVTSAMSAWFEESLAVRRWFAGFAERNGGVIALLDLESTLFPLLVGEGYVMLDSSVLNTAGPDAWVEAALAASVQQG